MGASRYIVGVVVSAQVDGWMVTSSGLVGMRWISSVAALSLVVASAAIPWSDVAVQSPYKLVENPSFIRPRGRRKVGNDTCHVARTSTAIVSPCLLTLVHLRVIPGLPS